MAETPMITHQSLSHRGGLAHGFFTREGGVSSGFYGSLNHGYGSGDANTNVAENRARAAAALGFGADAVVTGYQTHSTTVAVVERASVGATKIRADALVTTESGVVVGVLTADCAPVLLADPQAGVAAAVHAGWRGAVNGILAAAVETMETKGARAADITAVVGPCIGRDSYEVGPEFPEPFLAESADNRRFFVPAARIGHHQFDLEGYVVEKLHRLGLGNVAALGLDTCALEKHFFSYRRSQICHEADYGRLLSAIAL